mgnify:CR=1 FL=1
MEISLLMTHFLVLPLIAFPLLGLYELKVVASSYAHPLVLLFLGGFIIASAMVLIWTIVSLM